MLHVFMYLLLSHNTKFSDALLRFCYLENTCNLNLLAMEFGIDSTWSF